MAYLITVGGQPEFRIGIEDLKELLHSGWPLVEFETVKIPNDPMILGWSIQIGEERQLGTLHPDNQTISIDGFPPSVAKFAIWYRKNVPDLYSLFLSHDSSVEVIEITADTKMEELLDKLNAM